MRPIASSLHGNWHPIALAADLGARPASTTLLDQQLVIWRAGSGFVRCFDDRCMHRDTFLSLGTASDGCVVCP